MGKISALFMISLCFLFSANAQLKWGANAGVNISSITHVKDFNPKPLFTFQFSGFAIIPIGQSLEMQPCLGYRGKGYGVNERYRDSSQQRVNYDYNYLQLSSPLLLRCNTNDNYKWYAGAGPYLAYLINVKWDGSNVPMDSYHRIDFGIDFSIALTIRKRWLIALASDLGLSNVHSYAHSTNISSGITLGYFIN